MPDEPPADPAADEAAATPPKMDTSLMDAAMSSDPAAESVAVYARLKPVGKGDIRGDVNVPKRFGKQKSIQVNLNPARQLEFSLDWIFTDDDTQESVYDIAARDRVNAVLHGYNATILAYGQTGAGKTHSMFGPDEVLTDFLACDPALHGIVPRASAHIFEGLKHGAETSKFIIECSYLEIYNNTLNDLLGGKQNLPMREKPGTGLTVEGLSYEMVASSQEVMAALARGNAKRVVAAMKMNARSSRGHAIFTMHVKEILALGGEKAGKLNLVDLAGMESSKKSFNVEGASNNETRKVEAKFINTSLYALGSVIERLSEAGRSVGASKAHVPYRDSKLTRLLQDSLGGNSKSTIMVALRIETQNVEESVNTLRFAQRAKAVKTIVKDNTVTVKNTDMLIKEIASMNTQLETAQLMVRNLERELAQRTADDEVRLAQAQEEAAAAGEGSAADAALVTALREEIAVIKKKSIHAMHKSILHRIIQSQSRTAIEKLREKNDELVRPPARGATFRGDARRSRRDLFLFAQTTSHVETQLTQLLLMPLLPLLLLPRPPCSPLSIRSSN